MDLEMNQIDHHLALALAFIIEQKINEKLLFIPHDHNTGKKNSK